MGCTALVAGDGPVREVEPDEAIAHPGPGLAWIHIEGRDQVDLAWLKPEHGVPDVAAAALVARETRRHREPHARA